MICKGISSVKLLLYCWIMGISMMHAYSQQTADSCSTSLTDNRINMGLFGGNCKDITFSYDKTRIFAAMMSPVSLFNSDDSCETWKESFSRDSLLFECNQRGWGGTAGKVITNQNNWVGVRTSMEKFALTS